MRSGRTHPLVAVAASGRPGRPGGPTPDGLPFPNPRAMRSLSKLASNQDPRASPRPSIVAVAVAAMAAPAILVAGCADHDAGAGMAAATETLPDGATLVRHTPPPGGVPVTWRLEEELRIGSVEGGGAEQLGRVGGIAVTEDGRILVLDAQAQDIRVFGPDGRHLRTLGRRGGGPGELEGANGIVLGPDGLLRVLDGRNGRISYFHPDTGFVRSHPYNPVFLTWMWDGVLDEDGTLWAAHHIYSGQPGERGRMTYVGYDSAGSPSDTLPHPEVERDPLQDHPGRWSVIRDGLLRVTVTVPYYARAQHLLDPTLHVWATVEGDPAYRLELRTPEGERRLVLETGRPLQPVDRAVADSIAASSEQQFEARFDRAKIPELVPAISSFFLDDDGRLWVGAHTPDADSTRTFDAYDAGDGRWLGTLATDLRLMTSPRPVIRGDRVWAVVRDELDVPYVVRARMTPAEAAGRP